MEDIIKDTIIVTKLSDTRFKEIEEGLIQDGNLEKEQVAAEYEDIIKKQLQMLQADERGRQALQNEIAEIRRKQEKRAEALRVRAKALKIEKERAKKIANRPPPLPRSVRLLLKEQAKRDLEQMTEEVTSNTCPFEDVFEEDIENSDEKENIDEEYLEEKRKLQEEWDRKAKKRFAEALKKDRLKKSHDAILKDIENAEKLNRRQMARNLSEPTGKVPNYLPDKLHHAEKQVAMEDAVEDIFKKKNSKEHAIEDLEGYEDKWETKYKEKNSDIESRLIDCVPSFVKENYSYLLKEETSLQCGKLFTGLDDSTDDLNTAYIESPPADILNNSKEIDAVISQLDQMRVELNEAYEKEFKPLLEAGARAKVASQDKAVEADILKLPTEDKAVEMQDTPPRMQAPLSSRSIQVDGSQGGVMGFKRRHLGNMYRSHTNSSLRYLPESFACPSDAASEVRSPRSALESWSSSSYWSLPSKHGLMDVCKICEFPGCNTPLVEGPKDCVPLAKSQSKQCDELATKTGHATNDSADESVQEQPSPNEELHSSALKAKLSSYIQLVAEKYLKKPTTSPGVLGSPKINSKLIDCTSPRAESTGPTAFSKCKVSEQSEISGRRAVDADPVPTSSMSHRQYFGEQTEVENSSACLQEEKRQQEYDHLDHNLLKNSEYALLTNMNSSSEDELLQNCQKVIASSLSDVFAADNRLDELSSSSEEANAQPYRKESLTGYMYHDLSTIPEIDSALCNGTKESSLGETIESIGKKSSPKKDDLENISPEEIDTSSASLVDAPPSEVADIAKGIRFIRMPTPEPIKIDDAGKDYAPLISGSLPYLQTPSSVAHTPKYKIPSIPHLSDDQISNFSSAIYLKSSDTGSGSSSLVTPSPVSTVKSASTTKSRGLPYSSSYRDSNATRSHLTGTSPLSKYFQDVSSIRLDSEAPSSKSSDKSAASVHMSAKRQTKLHETSPGTFMPLTPHSYLSTQRQTEVHESSSDAFSPMTPQYYLSTPSEIGCKQKKINIMNKINQSSKNVQGEFETPDSNTGSFKPMTPYSCTSSISKITTKHPSLNAKPFSPRKDSKRTSHSGVSSLKNSDGSNPDSSKPLSLLSNVSTPKDDFQRQRDIPSKEKEAQYLGKSNEEYQYENTASSNFRAMTPCSYYSSPSDIHAPSGIEFSTGEELRKGSVNIRLKIANPYKNNNASPNCEEQEILDGAKSFTYPIQLRLNVEKIFKPSNDDQDSLKGGNLVQKEQSQDGAVKRNTIKSSSSKISPQNSTNSAKTSYEYTAKNKNTVKVPSSGFVPQLTPEDFTPVEKNNMDLFAAKQCPSSENSTDSKSYSKSSNRPFDSVNKDDVFSSCRSSLKISATTIDKNLKNSLEKVSSSTTSVENECRGSSSRNHAPSRSPNPILQALALQIASSTTPCATPSNGSSTENLSEMFAESKITYQSTPFKSVEELIQETGILEEPSLTLMDTKITIKPDSPERPKLNSDYSFLSEDFKTPSDLTSACFTPSTMNTPSDAASSPQYCDSPSMISFLKHEQSCFTPDVVKENKLSVKKTSQDEYKTRTKRLWNNLEEVRIKKLMEEKKEQMRKNREKMKSYSMKRTAKKN